MSFSNSLVWLRRDLRLSDHTIIHEACERSQNVYLAFVFDINILNKLKHKDDRRVTFIHESVKELKDKLKNHNSDLIVLHGDPCLKIPELALKLKVDAVFTGRDYEPYAKARDSKVQKSLSEKNIEFISLKDHVIFEERQLLTGAGQPFKVFTPYKNMWLKTVRKPDIEERKVSAKKLRAPVKDISDEWTLKALGFTQNSPIILPGESAAELALKKFKKHIHDYKSNRDFPDLEATSQLSMHFRFGTLSIREAVRLASESRTEGSRTWLSELIWRDFYHMILDQFPHVAKGCFKPEYDKLKWPGNREHFELWKEGQTGYPLIDAAMRHFKNTGWMHNRLRMVVAMFLTKDLLINWQEGERYFAENLLDFDLAANNGGWQWSASTGCDAQPYFRVFNPITQSEKFDADGSFIKRHVPELAQLPEKYIHNPQTTPLEIQKKAGCIIGKDYPLPIVDHATQRQKAIALFKQ